MKMNVIVVYDVSGENILMCLRAKNPYKGMYNLVGGKIEDGEDGLQSAYRELEEETGITKQDIVLTHLMSFEYHLSGIELQAYAGKLNKTVEVTEEVNALYWVTAKDNFFDMTKYAGEGNIGHMVEQVNLRKEQLFKV